MRPKKHPADAHDARLPPRPICAITGVKGFASVWPKKHPADAHDAGLPPRPICAITGVKGFASVWSLGGHEAEKVVQSAQSLG